MWDDGYECGFDVDGCGGGVEDGVGDDDDDGGGGDEDEEDDDCVTRY